MTRDQRPTVIVTGASSGVGLYATKARVDRGWHVVMASRDLAKAQAVAGALEIPADRVSLELIDLGSQASVRDFAARFTASGLPLHALVCNAAVYLPLAPSAKANDTARAARLWELSAAMVGLDPAGARIGREDPAGEQPCRGTGFA